MIANILPVALRQRFITILAVLGIAGAGLWSFSQLKLEAYPDLSETQVIVITLYPGHAAEEVEQQITVPLERALNSVPKVIARRSRTIFGLSVIDLTFEYGTSDYLVRQLVLEKLRDAAIPDGAEATLAPPTTPAGELYRYTLEGADEMQLREVQDWVIAPRLAQVPGVGDVFPFGGLIKQYQIEVDPLALYKYGLAISRVAEAVTANNRNAGGSLLSHGEQALVVRGVGVIRSVSDIENVVVASSKGTPVFVRDVGRVRVGPAIRTGVFGLNNQTGRVEGIVAMRRGENPSEVLAGVRAAVEELNAAGLPKGIRIVPIYDRTELVQNTIGTVSRTLAEGLAVVFLVLLFFLGSVEAALLTAVVVPLSLLFAFSAMYLYGITASLLSLGAIDFGIIVDGTLVMVEFIVRKLRHERKVSRERAFQVVSEAAVEIQRPIFFSLLILIAAYIPLFALERVERRLFMPMAFTICAALVGSLVFVMTLVPVLATFLFRRGDRGWTNPFIPWLTRGYERVLGRLLDHAPQAALATLLVLAGCYALGTRIGTEFLPHLDEGVIWVRAILPAGISLDKSAEVANRVRSILAESAEVSLVTSQTGRQESNTEPFGPNRTEFLVGLKPYSEWPAGKTKEDLTGELAERLQSHIPGAAFSFTQPIMDMVTEAVTGSSADLAVIVSGPDLRVLRATATQVLDIVRQVRGAADTAIEQEPDQAQLRIEVDRQEAARYGINVGDVQEVIELAIGGRPVSQMYDGERVFDIVVRYVPEARSTMGEIGNTLVPTADGGRIPLARLAKIGVADGASVIARRENRRQISVRTNIRGRDQGGFVADVQRRFAAVVKLPAGYRVEWGGQFENLNRASARLRWILPVTVAIIFALLYWAFGSVLDASLVLVNVPFSIAGGVLALYLRDINFSVSAAVGFVSLFGVAAMNGVLYLTEINRQLREYGRPLKEAVLVGACVQFRPRLMLIVIAILGITPAAFATGIGSDIQRPLATVIFGGLVSTLLLALLGLPSFCYLLKKKLRRESAA
ncbi:MAG TPA: CusA/CzcA family heavy metal efflux RND transporter [Bryobacteraceae bacterium]|nr:CusA/CzcA family heavy metal efflux RND transporter [Bryobacteraceae bacterium]